MRAIWKGNISFALVTIPISVFSATRKSEVSFKYLHKKDLSRVSYKRVSEVDVAEVPWEEITRGYEFEEGRFVEVTDEDFKRVNPELSRTIQIVEFVNETQIDPIYFDKPYYLEPQKGGERAYSLMRDALGRSGKVGIARVVLKSKEHLAAVKPVGKLLMMLTMRFAYEIVDARDVNIPETDEATKKEMALSNTLIEAMCEAFEPTKYQDEYRGELLDIIQKKIDGVAPAIAGVSPKVPGKVVDLMEVLKKSLKESKRSSAKPLREKTVATRSKGKTKRKATKKAPAKTKRKAG